MPTEQNAVLELTKSNPIIDEIKELADKAGSELVSIKLNTPIHGLPTEIPAFVDRQEGSISSVFKLFEEYRDKPSAKRGTAKVFTLESFVDLVDRHKTDASVIFANTDWTKPSLTAVIDYHEKLSDGHADNLKHRVHYEFPLSEEWKAWIKVNGKSLEQIEFAEFIEEHIAELVAPDSEEQEDWRRKFGFKVAYPNQLVELSRGLQVFAETRVKNNVVLQSGEGQIVFEEEHKDANGNRLEVPGMFIIAVPPFFMGDPARIPVRLRYRVSGGAVKWIIQLYRPDVYITQQVMRDLEGAAADTGLPHFQGVPEASA